ncbi:hypothetical protein CEXT_701981 [Caerostris extrusa]|uniref:Uncharacterized protein n=1 Tax=Caerostris extrusa TaxID=172846 RepID=A0AAV4PGR4_CAEEX|nr:hypothetical protein CEXT_701981 [Caerostris extrusa]
MLILKTEIMEHHKNRYFLYWDGLSNSRHLEFLMNSTLCQHLSWHTTLQTSCIFSIWGTSPAKDLSCTSPEVFSGRSQSSEHSTIIHNGEK